MNQTCFIAQALSMVFFAQLTLPVAEAARCEIENGTLEFTGKWGAIESSLPQVNGQDIFNSIDHLDMGIEFQLL